MKHGRTRGLITKADLAGYRIAWREPIQADWRSFRVITAPPPSSGGIALLQLLIPPPAAAAQHHLLRALLPVFAGADRRP
jgi:gamma-glutamyltranspeptidase/glutathione hydrolase